MSDDLAAWLLELIAKDEAEARKHQGQVDDGYYDGLESIDLGWKPDRVLAECEAKRRRIELHGHITVHVWHDRSQDFEICTTCGTGSDGQGCTPWPCDTLKLEALPFADSDGYREDWRL